MSYFIKESGLFILVAFVGLFCGVYLGLSVSKEHYDHKLAECSKDETVYKVNCVNLPEYIKYPVIVHDTIVKTKTVIKRDTVYINRESFKTEMPSIMLFKKE